MIALGSRSTWQCPSPGVSLVTVRAVGDERRFVVVSGLPGSGKSSLGRAIAPRLGSSFIDKDDFLERLLDGFASVDSDLRFRLSRQADDEMRNVAERSSAAVLVSFWRHEELSATAGTPTAWLRSLPNVVEVYCECSADVAAKRFLGRRRHEGHGDRARNRGEIARRFEALAALGPVGLGTVFRVDTEHSVDVDDLVAKLSGE
jgi:cytidylate kinase